MQHIMHVQELLLCMVAGHVHGRLWGDKDDEEDGDKNVDEDENEDGGEGMMITTVQQRHTPTQKKTQCQDSLVLVQVLRLVNTACKLRGQTACIQHDCIAAGPMVMVGPKTE